MPCRLKRITKWIIVVGVRVEVGVVVGVEAEMGLEVEKVEVRSSGYRRAVVLGRKAAESLVIPPCSPCLWKGKILRIARNLSLGSKTMQPFMF